MKLLADMNLSPKWDAYLSQSGHLAANASYKPSVAQVRADDTSSDAIGPAVLLPLQR